MVKYIISISDTHIKNFKRLEEIQEFFEIAMSKNLCDWKTNEHY